MGTWEEESSALFETQNEVNVDASSNGPHHGKSESNVEVEVVNDGGYDRNESEVSEADALIEKLERVELLNNGSGDSEIREENRDEQPGEVEGDGVANSQLYPYRPYATDCSFYIKTGTCKYGQVCRFSHPPKKGFQPIVDNERGYGEITGALSNGAASGKIDCKFFLAPGGCKYGDACRYSHSTLKVQTERLVLNFLGLPIRPLAQKCTYYLRNGSCGYGANCRFHHPDPGVVKGLESANSPGNGMSGGAATSFPRNYVGEPSRPFGLSQGTSESTNGMNLRNGLAYAPDLSSYNQAMPQNPGWLQNQAHVFSSYSANNVCPTQQALNRYPGTPDLAVNYEKLMQVEEFPERPGQPDCDYFMKTRNCKYRSACKYNHPMSRNSNLRLPALSPKGLYSRPATVLPVGTSDLSNLSSNHVRKNGSSSARFQQQQMQNGEFPERPGQPECEYYMKTGQCKFKSACRYHHPRNRVSTPSLCALSEKGLPLRPGAKLCRNYEQQGMCKYGVNCLFNHPDEHTPAAQVPPPVHRSSNVAVPTHSEPSALSNVQSSWDDGWGM